MHVHSHGELSRAVRQPGSRSACLSEDLEVAVVGAGPHGLSAAVHLRRRGVRARVFGHPMSFWKAMPRGMLLRSNMSATNIAEPRGPLSLASFSAATGAAIEPPVALEQFIEYGMWVAHRAVPDLDAREVARLERAPRGFMLRLGDGEQVSARRVVLACGIAPFAHTPAGFHHLPPGSFSHSFQHRELAAFRGRSVVVVGGGQSALESAALMMESGAARVEVLVRDRRIVWLRGHSVKKRLGALGDIVYAPTDVGPLWYSRLVARPGLFTRLPRRAQDRIAARSVRPACSHFVRVRLGEVQLTSGVYVRRAEADPAGVHLVLSDSSERIAEHLMFATGFEVDLTRYRFLDAGILGGLARAGRYPVLGRGLESSVPGLHIVGAPAAWSFGPIMRFVSGGWFAGRAVADAIAARPAKRAAEVI